MQRISLIIFIFGMATISFGCQTPQEASPASPIPPRPAVISHIVFFELNDPSHAEALLADCDTLIATIPGVVSYAAGRHLDVGRSSVSHDYDVALYIGFDTLQAYAAYIDHPQHTGLVKAWRSHVKALRVYDMMDPTP